MIRTAKWKPSPDNPNKRVYDGQRTAKEVYDDLETHLKSIGYLPDEYFLFDDRNWGGGREFPEDGWLTNQVDYGGSEGIYLDITLEYADKGEHKYEHFATGKTLGETGNDFDRMNLIASAVTKAFHADGVHARYIAVGGTPSPEGITVSLNPEERRIMADSLAQRRESLPHNDSDAPLTDRLRNRILGVAAGQERTPTRGITFSRVQLWADTGEESTFYMPGIPRGYDDLEADPEFIDFTEFIATSDAKEITAAVTPFSEGRGMARNAGPLDIDRISKAAEDCDVETIAGWRMGEKFEFAFDFNAEETLDQGMGGME